MDVAAPPRARAQPAGYQRDRDTNAAPVTDDSGAESESLTRRKFQRTATNPDGDGGFRKPSIPASVTRRPLTDRRPSDGARKRNISLREGMRVPSGPRDFPGSPGKRNGNMDSSAPAFGATPTRSYLTQQAENFKNPSANISTGSPVAAASRNTTDFDFIPPVNFDDFQSRLANFDGSSSLLSEFPTVGGGRVLTHEGPSGMAPRSAGFADTRPVTGRTTDLQNDRIPAGIVRSASYKFGAGAAPRVAVGQNNVKEPTTSTQSTVPLRSRRQSSVPQSASAFGQPLASNTTKQPRKSIGPGLFSNIIDRKPVPQTGPPVPPESSKPPVSRSASFSKSKRTIIQPSASAGAELPRVSTLTATTQSRQAKVRSVATPGREGDPGVSTARSPAKITVHRATTPSSSTGNKRQSVASGRISGLGARTISPTDARRLKRLSAIQAPPMPTSMPRQPPTPHDDDPLMPPRLPELPRFAQSNESFIPRKPSANHSLTPTSARTSPDNKSLLKGAEPSLSNRSSYQSLMTNPNTSASRLPQLKNRNVHSSSAQYGEESETIPPVPAIPKNYESPKEQEHCFFSNSRKSSVATTAESTHNLEGSGTLAAPSVEAGQPARSSFEIPTLETPRKATHRRNQTIGSPAASTTPATKPRNPPESTGRRNNTLQPLRLPPLNLLPLSVSMSNRGAKNDAPVSETQTQSPYSKVQTPEPKRVPKTPSTPMTASKATFFRREKEREAAQKQLRSASSQNALKDIMGFDETVSRFFDDSDPEPVSVGIPIQASKQQQSRSAITPFASGSLPKHSNEFVRLRGRPSAEYKTDAQPFSMATFDDNRVQAKISQSARQNNSGTGAIFKTANETPAPEDSPIAEQAPPLAAEAKKESGGLRRKLSLGWRRSSSKGANHAEHKSSPQDTSQEKPRATIRAIPKPGTMPPPKLPASATWSGDLPSLPSSVRPSLELTRKKSYAGLNYVNGNSGSNSEQDAQAPAPPPKTRALHSEQPQPVANRASSWGNFSFGNRSNVAAKVQANGTAKPRPNTSTNTISAIIKDKEDYAADEEMRRLSQKRRDVDQAARETEVLKKRALPRNAMSPDQVLHDRNCSLNIFERGEIMDYDKEGVYFTGTKDARKIIGSVSSLSSGDKDKSGNHGYDDERGDYNIVFGDHLAYRYEVVDVLGKGSFGQVVRCVDHKDGGIVAVKIIRNKKRFHQQALVEVGILGRLRDWDPDESYATLSITSSFYFRSHLCIVTPCLSINLYEFIRAHNFQGFSLPLIRRFSRQMVACLLLLQQKRIIHCDLKPENILLCEARKADVRVIDFGSSCREEEKVYTYIQSRFYRSPEVILGSSYGLGIDMWSFGCILAELWTGYPIFPGENEQEQLACIMEIFGPPDRHLVEKCTRKKLFFDSVGKPRVTVSSKGRRRRPSSKTLQQALKTEDEAFTDFISRCLRWDPERRLKPNEAVNHPFITNMPFNQRPGIPDEARRAARVRSGATGSTSTPSVPSPVKRTANQGNAFAQQQAQQQSASNSRSATRSTPQSSIRTNPPLTTSPSKPMFAGPGRRQVSVSSANAAAAVAGSKRASNGLVLGSQSNASGLPTMQSAATRQANPSLAQLAARESMANGTATSSGGATSGLGSARWRS